VSIATNDAKVGSRCDTIGCASGFNVKVRVTVHVAWQVLRKKKDFKASGNYKSLKALKNG